MRIEHRWQRPPIGRGAATREFVDRVLGDLKAGGFRPPAWARFWADSFARAAQVAGDRPRTAAEVNAVHLALLAVRPRLWVVASWVMAWSHIGLIGEADSGLGLGNLLTLARANLPVLLPGQPRAVALLALASDLADGRLARLEGREGAFGAHADAITDAVVWTWLAWRHDRSWRWRLAAAAVWLGPAALAIGSYLAAGRSVDLPRPPTRVASAILQVALTIRALGRRRGLR